MALLDQLPPLYPITHRSAARPSHVEQVRVLVEAGARLIQLREKAPDEVPDLLEQTRECVRLCRRAGVLLIVNDHLDLALAADAHGVHVGQGDATPDEIRRRAGSDFVVGLSTHDHEQFERACREPVAYIAVGPVFATATKADADVPTGLDFVRWAWKHRLRAERPLVAIGGIGPETLGKLLAIAPRVVPSVISAVWQGPSPGDAVRQLSARVHHARQFLADVSSGYPA